MIDALFFSWGFSRVVVGELAADLFKQVDVLRDIGTINVAELLDGFAKRFLALFREAIVSKEQLTAGTVAIKLSGHLYVSHCMSCFA
jgi:hypothetical protein